LLFVRKRPSAVRPLASSGTTVLDHLTPTARSLFLTLLCCYKVHVILLDFIHLLLLCTI